MTGRPDDDTPVTEAELHAWLDGELPEERHAAVERHLAANPDDAQRFERYRAQRAMLGRTFGPLIEAPLPDQLKPPFAGPGWTAVPRPPSAFRRWGYRAMAAAAVLLVFVAGGATGWLARERVAGPHFSTAAFVADAVSAHRVFTVEVRHPVEIGGDQETHLITWLSKRLGKSLRCPPLGKRGYELVGGRLLADADGPAAQLMYQDAAGRRITVYIRPTPDAPGTAFRFSQDGSLRAFYWRDNGLALAVTGDLDRATLSGIAEEVYGALNS